MMKKTIFFMLCLAPLGAQAAITVNGTSDNLENGYDAPGEISVDNMVIGSPIPEDAGQYNDFFAGQYISSNFTVLSGTGITINNNLNVAAGYTLTLGTASANQNEPIDVSIGAVDALGGLNVENIGSFSVNNSVSIAEGFSIKNVESVKTGAVAITGGNTSMDVSGNLSMFSFSNSGSGSTIINAANINIGDKDAGTHGFIENINDAQAMTINATGTIDVAGGINNYASSMTIDAGGDIIVSGVVSNSGSMILNAANLNIIGGGTTLNPYSFVSTGDLTINVGGTTTFAYGLNLGSMSEEDAFSLTTGTLNFGAGSDWSGAFSNKLNSFKLTVTDTAFDIKSAIVNGVVYNSDGKATGYNTNANMTLSAPVLSADSITNYATLDIEALSGAGVTIRKGIETFSGSNTDIESGTDLFVGENISNAGTMSLKAANVQLNGVTNNSGTLSVSSPTSDGSISVSGNVINNGGNTDINAKSISISGALNNNSGVTNINGSDSQDASNVSAMSVGSIGVSGGSLNLGALIGSVDVAKNIVVSGGTLNVNSSVKTISVNDGISIGGNLNFGNSGVETDKGDVYVANSGVQRFEMSSENGTLSVGGAVNISGNSNDVYSAILAANIMQFGSINVSGNNNKLVLGDSIATNQQMLSVSGDVTVGVGATVDIIADDADVGQLILSDGAALIARGTQISSEKAINIANGITSYNGASVSYTGLAVASDNLSLVSENDAINVVEGIGLVGGKTLSLTAQNQITVGGAIVNAGTLNLIAKGVAGSPNITLAGVSVVDGAVINFGVSADENAFYTPDLNVSAGAISVAGDVVKGVGSTGAFNLLTPNVTVSGASLNATGNYYANSGDAIFDITGAATFGGDVNILSGANTVFNTDSFTANVIDNAGNLAVNATNDISIDSVTNTGSLSLDSGAGFIKSNNFVVGEAGDVELMGQGVSVTDLFSTQNSVLYQNYSDGAVNISADQYVINTNTFEGAGVNQMSGDLNINASVVNIAGDVIGDNLHFGKTSPDSWINATVGGNVSGGVDFWGINSLNIAGNYTFSNTSDLWAAIMPSSESPKNYWSSVEVTDDNKKGEIVNADNGEALITVGDKFVSNISGIVMGDAGTKPQVGISLFDTVDQGTAIWLLHAENGIEIAGAFEKLRNLDVKFCNADGSICIDYADTLRPASDGTISEDGTTPIYISERDTDGDGVADSLYVVFDPNFGGPVNIFKLQPVVAETVPHTAGEYISAGALDNLIASQLQNTAFYNNSPIEIIPQIFMGTNLSQMANELYDRMEYYNMTGDGRVLASFSRLFQPRELEQIAGSIALNEHTNFRDFEDRMLDEFIWNRNRNLKKAWLDFDYGMFFQNVSDGKHADGQRFSLAGGFDWQASETTIFGISAHVNNSSSDTSDAIELGYLPNTSVLGTVDVNVDNLNIGAGAYMMKILGEKTRLYGNAFLDAHLLDVSRNQTFVDNIDGSGSAFSLISEWGLMHDWLNQYIVGNAYARFGYNFGFNLSEKAGGQDYMDMESDGYLILTPGYSLIAQKRIYPSAWFQIRPYASVGVEYDVLGTPDFVKYKFALADTYTKYDVDIDPLWANIGGGIEFLSANGIQIGVDYRYQYNDAIQLHNIKLSGSYRF